MQVTFRLLSDANKTSHANFEASELSKVRYTCRESSDYFLLYSNFVSVLSSIYGSASEVLWPNKVLVFSSNNEKSIYHRLY